MAKYEDYAKKHEDALQAEIDQAGEAGQDRKDNPAPADEGFKLPDKFKGKSSEEIAASYAELEKAYSRQGQDLGAMRTTADELLRLQSTQQTEEAPAGPLTYDDIYDDADTAIRRVVKEETGNRITELEQALQKEKYDARLSAMDTTFKGWREDVLTPEFANWTQESPYRARMAQLVKASNDIDAAEELVALYADSKGRSTAQVTQKREEDLRAASLETSGAGAADLTEKISRNALMEYRIAAQHGDPEAKRFLQANANAIALAYEEGRIID